MRALLISLLLASPVAHARDVWTVGPGGDAVTIGGAVALASSGDLVLVAPGTYSECVVVPASKPLTISSTGSSTDTTIDCGGLGQFAVDGRAGLVLSGFTVRNVSQGIRLTGTSRLLDVAVVGTTAASGNGGCVAANSAAVVIEDSAFVECAAPNGNGGAISLSGGSLVLLDVFLDAPVAKAGGGIYAQNASVTATRLTVADALATGGDGGGVFLTSTLPGTQFTCTDCDLSDGEAARGGAIYGVGAAMTLVRSRFVGNVATGNAGAVYSDTSLVARDTLFHGSIADGDAGALDAYGDTSLVGCTFTSNTSLGDGGAALYRGGGVLRSQDSTYDGNVSTEGQGGALWAAGIVRLTGDAFLRNGAALAGGAVYANALEIVSSELASNTGLHGAGFYAVSGYLRGSLVRDNGAAGAGGGLYLSGSYEITDSTIATNDAAGAGGGVSFQAGSVLQINTSDLVDNATNSDGGGLYASGNGASVTMFGTRVTGNTAVGGGGGIGVSGQASLAVEGSWIVENAVTSSGNRGGGGIMGNTMGALSLTTTILCRNTSASAGGAVALLASRSSRVVASTVFVENVASGAGGAWFESGVQNTTPAVPAATLSTVTFVGNDGSGSDGTVTVVPASPNLTARQVFSKAVFQSNGAVAITGPSGASNVITVNDSWFADHGSTAISGTFSGGGNVLSMSPDPILVADGSWSAFDGDCFDDVLIATDRDDSHNGAGLRSDLYSDDTRFGGDGDGETLAQGDCDPYDPARSSLFTEQAGNAVDEDCALGPDADADQDGYLTATFGGSDCDDNDAGVHPGAVDSPGDGVDQDCAVGASDDGDGDGHDTPADCDDTDPRVHPLGVERLYDDVEDACANYDDDADRDGYAAMSRGGADCDDYRGAVNPAATETFYDGVDQDCDGLSDFDADGDSDDCDPIATGCPGLSGGDCDDTNPMVGPSQAEVYYDGFDGNCDGLSDFDADGDGYDCDGLVQACGASGGPDCDDGDPNVYPGREETFDGKDSDCDGVGDVDTDSDGILDYWEDRFLAQGMRKDLADSDQDGIPDGIEWGAVESAPADTDDDGQLDAAELESDGDTVPDAIEGAGDTDIDGILDFRDPDDDGDGVPTEDEVDGGVPRDTDGDGLSDHLDPDSDDDGVRDGAEFGVDANDNGVPDHLDDASDGIPTPSDPARRGLGCDTSPSAPGAAVVLLLGLAIRRRR